MSFHTGTQKSEASEEAGRLEGSSTREDGMEEGEINEEGMGGKNGRNKRG